jgi:uncharacterized delta-60 repeat protein
LDVSFDAGIDGSVTSLAVQPDGKILVGGFFSTAGGQARSQIARLHPDGSADAAFEPGADNWVYSLAVQADGKILVGGLLSTLAGQTRNFIGRLYPNGSLDATLDPAASYDAMQLNTVVRGLALQADGKILVGGYFTTLGSEPRTNIGRLHADGSLDRSFNAVASEQVNCLVAQADTRILVGGRFNMLNGQAHTNLGRLDADGSLDTTFTPQVAFDSPIVHPLPEVHCLALQADGRIVVGGTFTTLGGRPRMNIGRLNANGSLDTGFNPGAQNSVLSLAVQPDGKILVGGSFTMLGGQSCTNIGRLNATGSRDAAFNPGANYPVDTVAVQADGKILLGGDFTTLGGQPRNHLGRVDADGIVDPTFNPEASIQLGPPVVYSLAVQADGRIIVGGYFTSLGGQARSHLGRLNADGSLDDSFTPTANSYVHSLALQPDGKILLGGQFTSVGGQARSRIGRLTSSSAALSTLGVNATGTAASWNRSGSSTEIEQVTFEEATTTYGGIGSGTRSTDGWQVAGLSLPTGQNFYLRARGRAPGGQYNGSSGVIESVRQFFLPGTAPVIYGPRRGDNGDFQFGFSYVSGVNFTVLATTNIALPASNWTVLGFPTEFAPRQYQFTDPAAANFPQRFYQLCSP